jgi:hypothetical protein
MKRLVLLGLAACTAAPTTTTTTTRVPGSAGLAAEPGWTRHTITAATEGAGTPLRGADGLELGDVDGDGDLDAVTPWEQGDAITVARHPDGPVASWPDEWPTTTVGTNVGAEDAIVADVDHDGRLDVVSASEGGKRIAVHFNDGGGWTTVTVSEGMQKWMQLAWDGARLYAGGKTSPATVGIWVSQTPRVTGSWSYTPIGPVGWTMSLVANDVDGDQDTDLVLTDRAFITKPATDKTLWGSRWLEQTPNGWVNHMIGPRTAGEPKFLHLVDWDRDGDLDVIDGASKRNGANFVTVRINGGDFKSWSTEATIEMPPEVGLYHDAEAADLDGDAALDLVLSFSDAGGDLSGVSWFRRGTWDRTEISGPDGAKFDTIAVADVDGDTDFDIITTEQLDGLGVVWFENPGSLPPQP